jgi:hypothetical protein
LTHPWAKPLEHDPAGSLPDQKPEFTDEQRANHMMVDAILHTLIDLGERVAVIERQLKAEDAASASLAHGLAQETEH